MKVIDIPGGQGSEAWHEHRRSHFNASDAPAMMGCSPYKTRNQLLRELHTGITADVEAGTQRLFDDGHRFEALARPIAEKIIGDDLYPITVANGKLSASLDGATLDGQILFEHKTLNAELLTLLAVDGATPGSALPLHYRVQMEQQLHCSDGDRVLFVASKWDANDQLVESRYCWYTGDLSLRQQIIAGWQQFEADLAAYTPPEATPVAQAEPQEYLPTPAVKVTGALDVYSNLEPFGVALREFIAKIPAKPSTDNEFATCEVACKRLKEAEDRLQSTEDSALASMASVELMRRTVAELRELARTTRLASEKLVKARKEQIREDEVARGINAFAAHAQALNARLGWAYIAGGRTDFGGAIKGLKSLDSVRNAIDTELARAKIEASALADKIDANLRAMSTGSEGFCGLFPDMKVLALKEPDDLAAVIAQRVAQRKAALEADRARIAAEEAARIERERRQQEEIDAAKAMEAALNAAARGTGDTPAAGTGEAPPNAQREVLCPGTPGAYAGNVAQAAQATPSGARNGAHAEQCAPVSYTPPGTHSAPAAPRSDTEAAAAIDEALAIVESDDAMLRDAFALTEHIAQAFAGKFPSHPKPEQSWWAELRRINDALQPALLMRLGRAA